MKNTKKRKLFKLNTVKSKMILVMALLAIVPLLTLGLVSVTKTESIIKNEVKESSFQVVNEVDNGLTNLFEGMESQMELLANNINFTDYYSNENNRTYASYLLKGTRDTRENYKHVYFATDQGELLMAPEAAASSLSDDFDPTSRPWYKAAAKQQGKLVIGEPYKDKSSGNSIVTLSKSVESNGQLVGVIGVDMNLSDLANMTNDIVIGNAGYVVLVDNNGNLITHPDSSLIGSDTLKEVGVWDHLSQNEEGTKEYTYQEEEKTSVFTTNDMTGWKVLSTLESSEFAERTSSIKTITLVMCIAFVIVALLTAWIVSRKISGNINKVRRSFKEAAQGDLTTRVSLKANDEFKELENSFNEMMEDLSGALSAVENSANTTLETATYLSTITTETSTSITQVASAIGDVAEGASSQAENTQKGSEEMSDLSNQLDQIVGATEQMNQVSTQSADLGRDGLQQVEILTQKSQETKDSSQQVGTIVQEINDNMQEINAFVTTISNITEQTNLLALNASIEAARAGEHGKGFAVVAEEVRKLAEESKASASQVTGIIEKIQTVVDQAVQAVGDTNGTVQEQEEAVQQTKSIFSEILSALNGVAEQAQTVKEAVSSSQENKDAVLGEIQNISALSEQTASSSEEVSASSEEISATMEEFAKHSSGLQDISEQLNQEMKKFKFN
ncbi:MULTISPECIES: methyl-accepting chemotaxis protein [Pontibacillus]|uniref:Methyl-accepting chemotaxis protein n=1 Tax=Pontibacillus chungwhensis TaxID=265426 RepID=A0ABY8UZ52_9BACI|nr:MULTISPECIES: methyl-accepting chemotaxis protein [Pontibacillus]MCD5324271.1 methyl-accepting chemotaxis protein [Pontibacillus sp. HN14]WIF97675.1 methyl-accepting chemotaxis protein [Pontibacillus chungwhensis]